MIVDGPEIEGRAEAGEVAGIGGGRGALSAGERQIHHESVKAEGRVNVEITKQDLLFFRRTKHASRVGLHVDSLFHGGCGPRDFTNFARGFIASQPARRCGKEPQHNKAQNDQDRLPHGVSPSSCFLLGGFAVAGRRLTAKLIQRIN